MAFPLSSCEVSYYYAEEVAGETATRFRGQPPAARGFGLIPNAGSRERGPEG